MAGTRLRAATALAACVTLAAMVLTPTTGAGSGAQAAKQAGVTCNQLHAEIDKKAAEFVAQYNAQGSSIDLQGSFQRCNKLGKRALQGKGYFVDVAPIPGETNPEVNDWYYSWVQVVTRTKKGKLRSTISNFRCDKTIGGGGNTQPGGPC
jgi:hypothetical protein